MTPPPARHPPALPFPQSPTQDRSSGVANPMDQADLVRITQQLDDLLLQVSSRGALGGAPAAAGSSPVHTPSPAEDEQEGRGVRLGSGLGSAGTLEASSLASVSWGGI